MNTKIEHLKESLKKGMVENFQTCGYLSPMLFYLRGDAPQFIPIPCDLLESPQTKMMITAELRNICSQPMVFAAGIIIEASMAMIKEDSEIAKLLLSGNMRVSEYKDKQDVIVMIFSTPEKEELISYAVDCKNKKVIEQLSNDAKSVGGMFSNFFNWNKKN